MSTPDAASSKTYRLRVFGGDFDVQQLRVIRRAIPEVAHVRPSDLRRHFAATPVNVLGVWGASGARRVVGELAAVGVRADFVSPADCGPEWLRGHLPGPPDAWESARQRVEILFMPSFQPEVVLRFWTPGRVQLATMQQSVWMAMQSPSEWLEEPTAEAVDVPELVPWSELANGVDLAGLLELADDEDVAPDRAYADGLTAVLWLRCHHSVRRHQRVRRRELHWPDEQTPNALATLRLALQLAEQAMNAPESLAVLKNLREYGLAP